MFCETGLHLFETSVFLLVTMCKNIEILYFCKIGVLIANILDLLPIYLRKQIAAVMNALCRYLGVLKSRKILYIYIYIYIHIYRYIYIYIDIS